MEYLIFESYKRRYAESQKRYNDILNEKEALFSRTQPKSMRYDKDIVSGGMPENPMEEYVIEKEAKRIDERLEEAFAIMTDLKRMLDLKETELRQSKDMIDRIYRMRFLERMRVNRIASNIGYAESHVYRFLKKIEVSLNDDKK